MNKKLKVLSSALALALVLGCILLLANIFNHNEEVLSATFEQRGWDTEVYTALNDLLTQGAGKGNYAVFDFDKTTIVHDISMALMVYQIENLRFGSSPEHNFLDAISDVNKPLERMGISPAEMGAALKQEYDRMRHQLDQGMTLEEVRTTDDYLDFRARFCVFLDAIAQELPEEEYLAWMPGLLTGMTETEAKALIKDAVTSQIGIDKLQLEEWTSPDGKWSTIVEKGIFLPQETKDLYRALNESGIATYVCSASLELIVEVLACDPEIGLGLDKENVFGLRFEPSEKITAVFDSTYSQPSGQGKADCIKACMAPRHEGRGPILVAGDNSSDVAMLTGFPDMIRGLIIDVGRNPESLIGKLVTHARDEKNKGRYVVQPSFAKAKNETSSPHPGI